MAKKQEIVDEHNILRKKRSVHIFSDIDAEIVSEIIRTIEAYLLESNEPIHIYINTPGGDVYSSLALYDYLRSLEEVQVKTYALGMAMSGGSLVFLAGDERYMFPNSVLMVHSVQASLSGGNTGSLAVETEECQRLFDQMCVIYGELTALSAAAWAKKIRHRDLYIRIDEAKELGFITGNLKEENKDE